MALPRVNWGEDKILGYEINHVAGEVVLQTILPALRMYASCMTCRA